MKDDHEEEEEESVLSAEASYKAQHNQDNDEIETWTTDSGCTNHYVHNIILLSNPVPLSHPKSVRTADGNHNQITHIGTAYIKGDENNVVYILPDTRLVPTFTHNLLSISRLTENYERNGISIVYAGEKAFIKQDQHTIITAERKNNLFIAQVYIPPATATATTNNINNNSNQAFILPNEQQQQSQLQQQQPQQQSQQLQQQERKKRVITLKKKDENEKRQAVSPTAEAKSQEQSPPSISDPHSKKMSVIHDLLGHLSWYSIEDMAKANAIRGLPVTDKEILAYTAGLSGSHMLTRDDVCSTCAIAKGHRQAFKVVSSKPKATYPMQRISADLCGPVSIEGQESMQDLIGIGIYLSIIVDEFSRFIHGKILSSKRGAAGHVMNWIPIGENRTHNKLMFFLSDHGGEYRDGNLLSFLSSKGVTDETTTIHTSQHNARAERAIRTVIEMTRALLHRAKLGTVFWGFAALAAIHILNRRIVPSNHKHKTPYELFTGIQPTLAHLHVFGCDAYAHVNQHANMLNHLENRSFPCVYLGPSEDYENAHKVYDPAGRGTDKITVLIRRDVTFTESSFTIARGSIGVTGERIDELVKWKEDQELAENRLLLPPAPATNIQVAAGSIQVGAGAAIPAASSAGVNTSSSGRYPTRERKPPSIYGRFPIGDFSVESGSQLNSDIGMAQLAEECAYHVKAHDLSLGQKTLIDSDPFTYEEAMKSSDREQWMKAMNEEMNALKTHNTWKLMDVPRGTHVIGCKWVFKKKLNSDGTVERYKARLCAKGFSQWADIDYHETFAPVMKYKSLRVLLHLACMFNYEADQMDVVTAFLNGEMKEEVYMRQPEGFVIGDSTSKVCKLIKTLYGTKQAPREWNAALNEFLVSHLHFNRCVSDTCVYIKRSVTGRLIIIGVFVDDMLCIYAPEDQREWQLIRKDIQEKFTVKDMGPVKWMLGMNISRERNSRVITVDTKLYEERILKRFNMDQSTPVSTPEEHKLRKEDCPTEKKDQDAMKVIPYRQAVGSLMYAALSTRVDLTHAVNELSSYSINPGMTHWDAVQRALRYLRGTAGKSLKYSGIDRSDITHNINTYIPHIEGYADADWAGDVESRKSTSGYVVKLDGDIISWGSKRQTCIARSTTTAEYIALSDVVTEIKWLRNLMSELLSEQKAEHGVDLVKTIRINVYTDNKAAELNIRNGDTSCNSLRAVDLRYHFVRAGVTDKELTVSWIPTANQLADILTKAVNRRILADLSRKAMENYVYGDM